MCEHEYLFKICDLKMKYLVMKKQNKIKAKLEQWSYLLNKSVVTIETNNHWKYYIKAVNDYHKQIHDVMAIETCVVIIPFGVVMAYAIVLNSPILTWWSNQNHWLSC
jgi:hypothetical protein